MRMCGTFHTRARPPAPCRARAAYSEAAAHRTGTTAVQTAVRLWAMRRNAMQLLQVFQPIRVMMLEFSCFLENYLWPNFDAQTASYAHVISIIIMVPPTRAAHPG